MPEILYYKFTPINESLITESKKGIVIDKEIEGYNQLGIEDSVYSGDFTVIGIGSTNTFTYNSLSRPERPSYSESEASLEYTTDSSTAYGAIAQIKLKSEGSGYYRNSRSFFYCYWCGN